MRGIADQNHAAGMPFIERDPVDWPAMDLLVAFEGSQIFLDESQAVAQGFRLASAVRNAALRNHGEQMFQRRFAPLLAAP
jgi:hypothetical protein